MKNMKISWVIMLVMVLGLIGGIMVLDQNQDARRGAYFSTTKLLLEPSDLTLNTGEIKAVQLWVDSPAKVDFVQAKICYGSKVEPAIMQAGNSITSVVEVNMEAFTTVELAELADNCLDLAISSSKPSTELKSGLTKVATIQFRGKEAGSGSITILPQSKVSGSNPNLASKDMAIALVEVDALPFTVGGGSVDTGPGANAKFKMSFVGLLVNAKCAVDWKVQVVALNKNGVTKSFSDVAITREGVVDNRVVFNVSKQLSGFSDTSNVALFLKGPKHLQTKYGVDGQDKMYNKAGGELTLGDKVNDFSKYGLLAGDINQDGVINGLDFTNIKAKVATRVTVSDGQNLAEDLNGDCQANVADIQIIRTSLQEKQGQLY